MLYIIYFNLRNGVQEEEFFNTSRELSAYLKGKVDGLGSIRLYRHHNGSNPRYFQMHMEIKDYGTWDRFFAFINKESKAASLLQDWREKMIDLNTHFDEFATEIPL